MSGGHYDYIYCKDSEELFKDENLCELEDMSEDALCLGYEDIAKDLTRLVEYIKSAKVRVSVLSNQLNKVMKGMEYYQSCDIGKDRLNEIVEEYRKGESDE